MGRSRRSPARHPDIAHALGSRRSRKVWWPKPRLVAPQPTPASFQVMSSSPSMGARSRAAPILLPRLVRWHQGRPSDHYSSRRQRTHRFGEAGKASVTPFKAAAAPQQQKPSALGLTLAPAANSQGVAITDVDPTGLEPKRAWPPHSRAMSTTQWSSARKRPARYRHAR